MLRVTFPQSQAQRQVLSRWSLRQPQAQPPHLLRHRHLVTIRHPIQARVAKMAHSLKKLKINPFLHAFFIRRNPTFFFEKMALLSVKEFHRLYDDLKKYMKKLTPKRQPKKRRPYEFCKLRKNFVCKNNFNK